MHHGAAIVFVGFSSSAGCLAQHSGRRPLKHAEGSLGLVGQGPEVMHQCTEIFLRHVKHELTSFRHPCPEQKGGVNLERPVAA